MPHNPYEAFRYPAFRRFMIGVIFVQISSAIQGVAIAWEIYVRTDDVLALGVVGLVQAIPMLLFTLPGGYLADVFDRKRLIQISFVGSTITSLGLAIFSYAQANVAAMFVLLFIDASIMRLATAARTAILPLLLPADAFESGVKWRSTLFQISAVAGPALGGFIIAWHLQAAYLICAASTAIFIAVLAFIKLADGERSDPGNPLGQLVEGLRVVRHKSVILGSISMDMFAVLLGGAVYLLPVYARDIIDLERWGLKPESALGWLRAAPGAGALVMALLLAHRPPMRKAGRNMFLAVAGFGFATIVFGLSRNFWLSMAMLFLTGFFDTISVVIRHTLVQVRTPNEMRGRVSAISSIFIGTSNELGGFESCVVAKIFNPVISVVSGGIGTLLIVGLWAKWFPSLRSMKKINEES
jgi:MFS family permease